MSDRMLISGKPVPEDRSHTEINPATGMQRDYVVLSAEERVKGFVKPVRRSYKHVGAAGPKNPLRDLTQEEIERYGQYGYVKYEEYPDGDTVCGKFWTQPEMDRLARSCGVVTTMGTALAETYARDPKFYSGTFCCGCGAHFPLNEFTWEPDGEPMDADLQEEWQKENTAKLAREKEERRQRRIAELKRELAELERQP